jgi:SAM-dependent methyltransferase
VSACPVCRSGDGTPFAALNGHPYRRCAACGCVYLAGPEPAAASVDTYTADYIRDRGHDLLDTPLAGAKEATAEHYLALLERHRAPGKLLEVGCSTGITLRTAMRRGWEVRGVEVNAAAVEVAARALGPDVVRVGPLRADMFPDATFDAAAMFDVIEHITEPDPVLSVLARTLVPGGALLVVTPDADSLSARLLRSRWPHLMLEHVVLYSRAALRAVLARHGFEVVKTGWAMKYATTELVRRHFACHPNSLGSRFVVRIMEQLRALERVRVPLNLGEIYVVATKR